jgi:UDP-N-acetylmuramoyl-L-alanyl-D-glutamate--2,6-diaminopimelate ligase
VTEAARSLDAVRRVLRDAGLLEETLGAGAIVVTGVCQDSRLASAGDLYLAWSGTAADGHDFVADAVTRGAVAAVVERPVDAAVPQLVVRDGRHAAALASAAVLGFPHEALRTLAVTGTNGKTTTAFLIRHLLSRRMRSVAIGTLGLVEDDGSVRPGSERLTTPGPVQLATWLRELADEGAGAVVMEASSHALEQRRLDGVRFDVVIFTNLTQDHLDYHHDLESYRGAKARLVELAAEDGTVIVNRDERQWDGLPVKGRTLRTYAIDREADVRAADVKLEAHVSHFTLRAGGAERRLRLPLAGRYNVENALAAAAATIASGLDLDEVADGLESAPQVPGRLETVVTEPFTVLIDFAHTPAALTGLLAALRPLTPGRLIVVFGAGGDRDRTKRAPMAEAVRAYADVLVLTSDNPRTEDPDRILDDLAAALEGVDFARFADRREAIRHALGTARRGDTVVLAGKGHERYQVVGEEKRPFDERAVVHDCLHAWGAA